MAQLTETLATDGVAFFRPDVEPGDNPVFLRAAEIALSETVTMFPVLENQPMWQRLEVDPDKETHRLGGTGYNPMHMDFVNTTKPPRYLALACARKDPLGGGETLLAPTDEVVAALDEETKGQLRVEPYTEGKFFNLLNVGDEYRGFPVLDDSGEDKWLRFSGKMLPPYNSGEGNMELLRKVDAVMKSKIVRVLLEPGEVAILDQRRYLHGRDALGEEQESIVPDERRLLYQGFFKPNES